MTNTDWLTTSVDPSTDAPKWRKGNIVTIVMVFLTILVSETVNYLYVRDERSRESKIAAIQSTDETKSQDRVSIEKGSGHEE